MSQKQEIEWKAWIGCGFLFLATALNYMDRQALAIAAPLIQRELKLDNTRLGLLFSAFFFTYGLMQLAVGPVLDRVSIRLGYAVAVCWWSLAGALTGLVHGFGQLFACRLMLGAGEAANWPAALRFVSQTIPPEKRSLANGFFNSGASLGAIVTPPIMVWLSNHWSWRMGFVTIGALALVWVVGWLALTSEQSIEQLGEGPAENRIGSTSDSDSLPSWGAIIRSRKFCGLVVASAFGNPCYYFYSSWLPTYFVQERGMAFGVKLGGSVMVPYLGLGIGSLLGGLPVLHMNRRGLSVTTSRKLVLAVATGLMLFAVFVPWIKTTAGALALIFIVTMSMGSWLANYLSFAQDLSPKHVAAVAGVIGSAGAFSGAFFIWLVGKVSTLASGFGPVFVALGLMPVIATSGIIVIMSGVHVTLSARKTNR